MMRGELNLTIDGEEPLPEAVVVERRRRGSRGSQFSVASSHDGTERSPSPRPPTGSFSSVRRSSTRSRRTSARRNSSPEVDVSKTSSVVPSPPSASPRHAQRRHSITISGDTTSAQIRAAGPLLTTGGIDSDDDCIRPGEEPLRLLSAMSPSSEKEPYRNFSSSDSPGVDGCLSPTSLEDVLSPLPVATPLDDYELDKSLGEGAFATVRLATHKKTNMKVAIKILDKTAIKEEYVRKNLRREGNLLKNLRHPHVIELYEIIETDDKYCLVTELASGGEILDYIVAHGALSEREARKYCRQMISAVDYLHHGSIVHRDLKAENLLLDHKFNLKIVDFGLSNSIEGQDFLKTQCGSPAYTAPELLGGKKYDERVDIWSIGINLYAMLTGKLPFSSDNITLLHAMILDQNYFVPPDFSPELVDLLSKILVAKPQNRISMTDLRKHPWIALDGCGPIIEADCPYPIRDYEINQEVVSYLEKNFQVSATDLEDSLLNSTYDSPMSLYLLAAAEKEKHGFLGGALAGSQKKKRTQLRRANTDLNLAALQDAHMALSISRETSAKSRTVAPSESTSPVASARRSNRVRRPSDRERFQLPRAPSRQSSAETMAPSRRSSFSGTLRLHSRRAAPAPAGPKRGDMLDAPALDVNAQPLRTRSDSRGKPPKAPPPCEEEGSHLPSIVPGALFSTTRRGSLSLPRKPSAHTSNGNGHGLTNGHGSGHIKFGGEPPSRIATSHGSRDNHDKIRSMRYPMNKQMVSHKNPSIMLNELTQAVRDLNFKISKVPDSPYCLRIRLKEILIEAEVVKLPGLNVHGIHFQRVKGEPFEVRELCSSILDAVKF